MKKVIVHFELPECSERQYDQIWNDLKTSGIENPQGLLFHVGGPGPSGGWLITDVWNSQQDWERFCTLLKPIWQKNKLTWAEPTITTAHNLFQHVFQHLKEEIYS